MGFIAPHSPAERFRHGRENTHYNIAGDEFLTPTNLNLNWAMTEINLDGDPQDLFAIGMPEDPEGYFVYVSEKDAGPQTMAAQNTVPFDIDEATMTVTEPWVAGHSPRVQGLDAAEIAPPQQPLVSRVAASRLGFAPGDYYVSYCWIYAGFQTPPAPFVKVTIASFGQQIRVTLPQSVPELVTGIGLLMSPKGQPASAASLQDTVDITNELPEFWTLTGPFKISRQIAVTTNETKRRRPKKPRGKKVRGHRKGKKGSYVVQTAFITEVGTESEPSEWSEPIHISEEEANANTYIEVDWGDESSDPDERYRVYVERVSSPKKRFFWWSKKKSGGRLRPISKKELVKMSGRSDEDEETEEEEPSSSSSSSSSRRGMSDTSTEEESSLTRKGKKGKKKKKGSKGDDESSAGEEDNGIEIPTDPLAAASVIGQQLLETNPTGWTYYWVALSYWVRGEETPPCAAQLIALAPGETIRVFPNEAVNLLRNAQFSDLDSDGKPDGWILSGIAGQPNEGSFNVDPDGTMRLRTLGQRDVPANPSHRTPQVYSLFQVNRAETYTLGGTIAATLQAGNADIMLFEYASDPHVTSTATLRSTQLKRLTASGQTDFTGRFGEGTNALAFHAQTTHCILAVNFSGTIRNGEIAITELFAFPHPNRIRRILPPSDPREPVSSDPPARIRWSRTSQKMVGPPPTNARRVLAIGTPPYEKLTFGDTSPTLPVHWASRAAMPGVSQGVSTLAAIDGPYGYAISKTTTDSSYGYLLRGLGVNAQYAVRAKVRVRALPTFLDVSLVQLKFNTGDGDSTSLADIRVYNDGRLVLVGLQPGVPKAEQVIATGVALNDVLDLELVVSGAGTSLGYARAAVGKNGTRRAFAPYMGPLNWVGRTANVLQLGVAYAAWPSTTWYFDFDSVTLTDAGDTLVDSVVSPPMDPIPLPDRPYRDPEVLETVNFNSGTLPFGWTSNRTPADASTTLSVIPAAAIEGSHGLRVADGSTTNTNTQVYAEEILSTPRTQMGFRTRMRVVARPVTGGFALSSLNDAAGNTMAWLTLDAFGDVYLVGHNASGTTTAPVKVATGATNGTILTLEMVASGANTATGQVVAWVQVGGTGAITSRQLMTQPVTVDWTGREIGRIRLGLMNQSVPATTATVDFDSVVRTTEGEVVFREKTASGQIINQAYAYYVDGTPLRDDLWAKDWRRAVMPGETYTVGLWTRIADVRETAFPYTFTCYDTSGNPHEFEDGGCLFGEAGFIGTTSGWVYLEKSLVIPENCYEIRMSSPDISSGEFVAQEFVFSPGTQAIPEVTYPVEGEIWVTLDTDMLENAPEPISGASFHVNRWLDLAAVCEVPDGCEVDVDYGSSATLVEPAVWHNDSDDVPEARYAHFRIVMQSDPTHTLTPVMRTGFPYVEYATFLDGHRHIPKLLRSDGTEFPGGAYVIGVSFPRRKADYDIRAPLGRTRAHRRTEPVLKLSSFSIRVLSEEAMAEIEETALEHDFMVEAHGRRFIGNFISDIEAFEYVEDAPGYVLSPRQGDTANKFYAVMEAEVEGLDVYEVAPMTTLPLLTSHS